MLEYFAYKKFKKHRAARDDAPPSKNQETETAEVGIQSRSDKITLAPAPVLNDEDQEFLELLTTQPSAGEASPTDGVAPPLPPRINTPDLQWDSDTESFRRIGHQKPDVKEDQQTSSDAKTPSAASKLGVLTWFMRKDKPQSAKTGKDGHHTSNPHTLSVPDAEVDREKDDLTRVLDDLNLAASNNKAFSLSTESTEMVRKFTVVLKDLVNGVPTAVDDLKTLFNDNDGTLAKQYEKLPKSLKKLVTQLPDKLTATLAPELLAVAAEAQGLANEDVDATGGFKGAAKRLFMPTNLSDLVTKPSAIVGMLKGIVNALKLRWPAFIGSPNLIFSVAVFLLLLVLWYCHKRGREVRLEKEKSETVDAGDRVEELPDDAALPAPQAGSSSVSIVVEPPRETRTSARSTKSCG